MSPKVSVCITTYNHGAYIAEALENVLAQRTNFEFEVIVGEDDSSDCTREIVCEYANRYPEKIRLFLNDRANVIYINGRPTGRWNFINNLKHAHGEYIALLEGDDYWIDNNKLQKQVDFLDEHQDYSMCFTDAQIWDEDSSKFDAKRFCETFSQANLKQIVTFSDIALGHWIPTASVVYRRIHCSEVPSWFYQLPMADWGLFLLLLNEGPGRFMNECTSVYRVHKASYWSSLTQEERERGTLRFLEIVKDKFGTEQGRNLNQLYWLFCSNRHREMSGLHNKMLWFYYRLKQKLWKICF